MQLQCDETVIPFLLDPWESPPYIGGKLDIVRIIKTKLEFHVGLSDIQSKSEWDRGRGRDTQTDSDRDRDRQRDG